MRANNLDEARTMIGKAYTTGDLVVINKRYDHEAAWDFIIVTYALGGWQEIGMAGRWREDNASTLLGLTAITHGLALDLPAAAEQLRSDFEHFIRRNVAPIEWQGDEEWAWYRNRFWVHGIERHREVQEGTWAYETPATDLVVPVNGVYVVPMPPA